MPIYLYECRSCNKQFEVEQRITENSLTDCDCGQKVTLRKLIQPIAVMFKGSGFHINDYAPKTTETDSASPSESAKTEVPASKGGTEVAKETVSVPESKSEPKSESKPEAKSSD